MVASAVTALTVFVVGVYLRRREIAREKRVRNGRRRTLH